MSKKIEEGIKRILDNKDSAEEKIKSILELKFTSSDIKRVEDAIIDIYAKEYDAELTKKDIDSEISNIAYRNEGILSISDENTVSRISEEKEELLSGLRKKLNDFKETKKRVEEPEKIEETEETETKEAETKEAEKTEEETEEVEETPETQDVVIDARDQIDDDLKDVFEAPIIEEPRNKYTPTLADDIFEQDPIKKYDSPFRPPKDEKYHPDYKPSYRSSSQTSEPNYFNYIDRELASLEKESIDMSNRVKEIKDREKLLLFIKNRITKLETEKAEQVAKLDDEYSMRRRLIDDEFDNQYAEIRSYLGQGNHDSSSLGIRL